MTENDNVFFNKCMTMVQIKEINDEDFADSQLLIASNASMSAKLSKARRDGRHGWWDPKVCSIDELYQLRKVAFDRNDHISIMNYSAMIAMRESVEEGKA